MHVFPGDVIEQHPVLADMVIGYVLWGFVADKWVLKPLFGLIGFGPLGPVKGALSLTHRLALVHSNISLQAASQLGPKAVSSVE